jgi:DNA topoisomerase VI subunit B
VSRETFATSRLLDFVSEKELTMQCGFGRGDWPLVVVKELIDNALDACEEQGIPPRVAVTVGEDSIAVADNGAGIPPDVVDRLLDFSVRVSSREAYVAPDRGAQGNALKTVVAMPFVLDGDEGRVDIAGGGRLSEIRFSVDRIRQRPVADVERRRCKASSLVRVWWPAAASSAAGDHGAFLQDASRDLRESADEIRDLVAGFSFLNPHATLALDVLGERATIEATDPGWTKWTPSSPTSAHWYEPEHLERLIAAYVVHDDQAGREGRTVREFVAGFKGLTSTAKQKRVLEATGLARAPLAALVDGRDFDHAKVRRLLAAMREQTAPTPPRALGRIGRGHLAARLGELGVRDGSFEYRKVESLGDDGLPQLTEIAFAALADEDARRRLVMGVNWSAAWVHPFRQLGRWGQSLDTMLAERRLGPDQPIALVVHVAHPRVEYADRGKSTVVAR